MSTKKIVEPVAEGVPGRLRVKGDEVTVAWNGGVTSMRGWLPSAGELGLSSGDELIGWLQCYRGWSAQHKETVEKLLSSESPEGKNRFRVLFRVSDFEHLSGHRHGELSLVERKALLDRLLSDRDALQKNPYVVLEESAIQRFLESQPSGLEWRISDAVSAVDDSKRQDLDESSRVQVEVEDLKKACLAEERFVHAGRKYFEQLRAEGERCIRALASGGDCETRIKSFSQICESPDVCVETLERKIEGLRAELVETFPVKPVARSSALEVTRGRRQPDWEMFRIQRDSSDGKTER